MSIKMLLIMLCISLLSFGAYINRDEIEYRNIEFQEYPLQITCPKCGFIYYYMTIPELIDGEEAKPEYFHPAPGIQKYVWEKDWEPCPNDGTYPAISGPDKRAINGTSTMLHTNKGWQPTRVRPTH